MDKGILEAIWTGLPIAPLIFVAYLVIVVAALFGTTDRSSLDPIAKPLLTPRESAMLMALEEILPMFRIYPQVAMGALLAAPRRFDRRPTPADRNAFSQKIVDFVIFDHTNGKVVALVELDDRTHRADRDARRDEMTARAGYRTIRIPATARPTVRTAIAFVGPFETSGMLLTAKWKYDRDQIDRSDDRDCRARAARLPSSNKRRRAVASPL
jgi:hypothetical protein